MRIGIQAWGSEGDVRPFLALGSALAESGHDVTVVLTDFEDRDYDRYEATLGLTIRQVATPVIGDPAELDEIRQSLLDAGHPVKQSEIIVRRMFDPVVPAMFEAAQVLAGESDLMIGHFFHHPANTAAEAAGIPGVTVTLAHNIIASGAYPPEGIPDLGGALNRFFWKVAMGAVDHLYLKKANAFRSAAGLPTRKHMSDIWHSSLLDLVAVSPSLCPTPSDWPERHRVCGFLNLPATGQVDTVDAELEAFLGGGEPPVFITFGSLTPRHAADRAHTRRILEDAVARARCRAVIQGFVDPGDEAAPTDARILHLRRAPHAAVFPRCAAVLHHGGAGTTQTALAAGAPSVVVPHVADQFFWGAELHRLGVAARPLPRTKMTSRALADRITSVLGDPRIRPRVRALGEALSREDGAHTAARLVEAAFERARPKRPAH